MARPAPSNGNTGKRNDNNGNARVIFERERANPVPAPARQENEGPAPTITFNDYSLVEYETESEDKVHKVDNGADDGHSSDGIPDYSDESDDDEDDEAAKAGNISHEHKGSGHVGVECEGDKHEKASDDEASDDEDSDDEDGDEEDGDEEDDDDKNDIRNMVIAEMRAAKARAHMMENEEKADRTNDDRNGGVKANAHKMEDEEKADRLPPTPGNDNVKSDDVRHQIARDKRGGKGTNARQSAYNAQKADDNEAGHKDVDDGSTIFVVAGVNDQDDARSMTNSAFNSVDINSIDMDLTDVQSVISLASEWSQINIPQQQTPN